MFTTQNIPIKLQQTWVKIDKLDSISLILSLIYYHFYEKEAQFFSVFHFILIYIHHKFMNTEFLVYTCNSSTIGLWLYSN